MYQNFIICVEAVIPMFIMLFIGWILKMTKTVKQETLKKLNSVIFKTLFPFLIFDNIYSSDIQSIANIKLIVIAIAGIAAAYLMGMAAARLLGENLRTKGAMVHTFYRSNYIIMGIPIVTHIYGHSGIGVAALLIAIVIPIYNLLAVGTLEYCRGGKPNMKNVLKGIAKNPLIVGAAVAIVVLLLGIRLPNILEETVSELAAAASPIALIILGASFRFSSIQRCGKKLVAVVLGRLVIVPAVCLTAGALLGIRGVAFVTLISIFAAPCAISSYSMAIELDSDTELTGNAVIFTSIFSCLTLFGWLFLFKTIGMF